MYVVSVYPHNDNATPFKLNFNTLEETNEYCLSLENKKCEFFVLELSNQVWGELD